MFIANINPFLQVIESLNWSTVNDPLADCLGHEHSDGSGPHAPHLPLHPGQPGRHHQPKGQQGSPLHLVGLS